MVQLSDIDREKLRPAVDLFIATRKRADEYVDEWKPRQKDEWAVKAPPIIDKATLEEAQTGRELTPEQFEKMCNDRRELELQSIGIAARLKRSGINVYQDSVAVLGLYTEEFSEKTQYRNTNFIPEVQAKNTHDMLKSVQYYLDTQGEKKCRMWVLSAGWVPLYQYREAHQKFTRFISKFSKHKKLQATQIEFAYYSIESTFHKKDGMVYANLHAHVLLRAGRYLGLENWKILIEDMRQRVPKGYLHDSPIARAAEVVKYCFKPAEFDLLNDDQMAYLFTAVKGLRFYQPLGKLKEFRGQLKESKLKLKHIETDSGPEWRLVKSKTRSKDERERENEQGGAKKVICGITAPSPVFSETFEPCVLIRNFDGNIQGFLALNPWIEQRMAGIRQTVERQQERHRMRAAQKSRQAAKPSMRHTTTITVQDFEHFELTDWHAPPDFDPGGDFAEATH